MECIHACLRLDPDDLFTCLKFGNLLTVCDDKHYARELFDRAIYVGTGTSCGSLVLGQPPPQTKRV